MIRYNCIESDGSIGPWTGSFKTIKEANRWFNLHGQGFIKKGIKLVITESNDLIKE